MVQSKRKTTRLIDVARVAKVSCCVAGHVLNGSRGNSRVSLQTAQRIREAAQQLNYQPNHAARLLRGKRSYTYGLLVASAGDPLRSFLVQYLDAEAVKIGNHTYIGNTIGNPSVGPDQFDAYVEEFARRQVDGVFCAVHHWFEEDRQALLTRHPNTVFYEAPGIPGATYITVDREEAARLAVRHLAERGRRRIALAVMTLSRPTHLARRRGYEAELRARELPLREELIFNGEPYGPAFARCNVATQAWEFPHEVIDRAIEALILRGKADAVVAYDDFWAASLLTQLRLRGIRVPDDVAIVGYLNHYLADWTDPPLTTVDLQHEAAARQMVHLLERMITEGSLPESERVVKITPKLIVRKSA
ncbi:MAG: LacI family DNA-binding transcriptional regulator [Pirellulales bacterium]|nr:LacI family DNA-binding transcriptional regulator [Pirellulales bacterium]